VAALGSLGGNEVQDSVQYCICLNRQARQDRKGEPWRSFGI